MIAKPLSSRGERIAVPAGTFETLLVARTTEDGSWVEFRTEQWFAEIGLVRLRHRDTDVQRRTGERGEDLGEFSTLTTVDMELQSYSIP